MIKNITLFAFSVPIFFTLKILGFIRNTVFLTFNRRWEELSQYFFSCAHGEDIAACSFLFNTTSKSVSGMVGLKAKQEREAGIKKSYIYPWEKLIDWLFSFDPKHTYKAAKYENPEEF